MTLDELNDIKRISSLPFPIKPKAKWDKLIINNRVAIPVERIASYYMIESDISIKDPVGNEIGVLCFTKELGAISWNQLTENQFIAFLVEADISDRDSNYKFSSNYVVIREDFYLDYRDIYEHTAALWGGFFHDNLKSYTNNYTKTIPEIAILKVNFKNEIYLENLARAVSQPFAFERYLKLYHLLELRFDLDVVKKIQAIDLETDYNHIGDILNEYNNPKEYQRLLNILMDNCHSIMSIVEKINAIKLFPTIAIDIFYRFGGKDSNPFKEQEARLTSIILSGFDETNLKKEKIDFQKNYRNFILKVASYWIYRTRCCIAHSKMGEYILSINEENFIVEFAEPLLKEVLAQCFKN